MEKNEENNLVESSANENLERSLREAGQKKKGSRKTTRQKKKRKQSQRKKTRKQKNKGKARKGKKQNAGNKEKSKKKRKGKKGKKARKQKKRKQGRKSKKGRKLKNKGKRRKNAGSLRATATCNGTALESSCLTNLISALKYERDAVANFMNQKARAEDFKKLIGKKEGKNDTFTSSTTYLLTALGGNVSNLTCGSQNSSGDGAITT